MLRVGGPFGAAVPTSGAAGFALGDAAREALALRQASPGASRERSETKSASSP
jgi:hypothetical protein